MSAAWMLARAELRARWGAWVALAILIGVAGGVVLTTAAGARRTVGSFERLLQVTKARDALVQNNEDSDPALLKRVAELPQVETSGIFSFVPADSETEAGAPFAWSVATIAPADERMGATIDVPRLIEGRRPDQSKPHEVGVSRDFLATRGLTLGDTLTIRTLTFDELFSFFGGTPQPPTGPVIDLTIVGVLQLPDDVRLAKENKGVMLLTRAFHDAYAKDIATLDVMTVRLRNGARDFDAFSAGARRIAGGDQVLGITTGAELEDQVGDALRMQSGALWLFAAIIAAAALVLFGQTLSRAIAVGADAQHAAAALGAGNATMVGALLIPAGLAAVAGALLAGVLGIVGSVFMPVGFARSLDPALGVHADALVLGIGGAACLVLVGARAALAAFRLIRRRVRAERQSPAKLPDALARAGAPATMVSGSRFAFDPGRGRAAVPVGGVLLAIVAGVFAMTSASTFESSFRGVLDAPETYGFNWDLVLAGGEDKEVAEQGARELAASPLVEEVSVARASIVTFAERDLDTLSIRSIKGNVAASLIEGRAPQGRDEIALATRTMRDAEVTIGDRFTLNGNATECKGTEGCPVEFEVTGRVVFWSEDGAPGEGAVLTEEGQARLVGTEGFVDHLVRLRDGATGEQLRTALGRGEGELIAPRAPVEVQNLGRVRPLTTALTMVLALFALATTAIALITAISRRRRDLGVLKVLGFVRGQVRRTVAWHASLVVAVSMIIGVPLGVVAGRWIWSLLANNIGIAPEPRVGTLTLLAGGAGLLALAILMAMGPARRAARTQPAIVLRSE